MLRESSFHEPDSGSCLAHGLRSCEISQRWWSTCSAHLLQKHRADRHVRGIPVGKAARLKSGLRRRDTLDLLCGALAVGPGELLEWLPEKKGKRG